jgi:hypothetical protein
MKAAILFFLLAQMAEANQFRWSPLSGAVPPLLAGASRIELLQPKKSRQVLYATGEIIVRETQRLGNAEVAGSWLQTIYLPSGSLAYATGVVQDIPIKNPKASFLHEELALILAKRAIPEMKVAQQIFTPKYEARKKADGSWEFYWKIDYLNRAGDRLFQVYLSDKGVLLEQKEIPWDGADGRALVFPKGPKLSGVSEEAIFGLLGDGSLSGQYLQVRSALNLQVFSPELTFFFPEEDRRFDFAQAYYSIDRGLRWLKEKLGVELPKPISVRLHVGENGVSNAAFYHQNMIYLGTGDGITYKDLVRDPTVLIHEAMHAVIDAYVGFSSDGEAGAFNEGFSDLFTALMLDNPRMGEASYLRAPFRRSLENNLKAYKDFGGIYQTGSILGATFWDMRAALGNDLVAQLAFRTMVRLGKGAKLDDFGQALTSAAQSLLSDAQRVKTLEIAKNRGWKLEP